MWYRVRKELRGAGEIRLLPILADQSRDAIDASANKGVYTRLIARFARHTFAFEPNPKMFRLLRRNLRDRCTASPIGSDWARSPPRPARQQGPIEPGCVVERSQSLGKLHGRRGANGENRRSRLGGHRFIKIDVEGFESAVLRGARQTIARDRPTIFVEIKEQHTKRPIEQSLREVLALGYRGLFCSEGYSAPCPSSTRRGTIEPAMASTCSTSSSYLKPEIVQPW